MDYEKGVMGDGQSCGIRAKGIPVQQRPKTVHSLRLGERHTPLVMGTSRDPVPRCPGGPALVNAPGDTNPMEPELTADF